MKKILGLALVVAMGLSAGSVKAASYAWREYNDVASSLTPGFTYSVSGAGTVATVSYTGQTFTNNGAAQSDVGMYFGWNWIGSNAVKNDPDYSGYQALPWSNALQAFTTADFDGTGSSVKLQIQSSVPTSFLSLATVGDPTLSGPGWTGTPYSYGNAPLITTDATLNVPFLDFGAMAANQVKTYDISFVFTFSSTAGLNDFGDFYVSAQGVAAVPVPASVWGGAGLIGLLAAAKVVSSKKRSA